MGGSGRGVRGIIGLCNCICRQGWGSEGGLTSRRGGSGSPPLICCRGDALKEEKHLLKLFFLVGFFQNSDVFVLNSRI